MEIEKICKQMDFQKSNAQIDNENILIQVHVPVLFYQSVGRGHNTIF